MDATTKILVIEDQEIISWGLERMVTKAFNPSKVYTTPNFQGGMQILEQTHIDLTILDIDVPGSKSVETINLLRNAQANVKILIHTGLPELEYAPSYMMAGADGFVSKQASLEDVLKACKVVLQGRKYASELVKKTMRVTI